MKMKQKGEKRSLDSSAKGGKHMKDNGIAKKRKKRRRGGTNKKKEEEEGEKKSTATVVGMPTRHNPTNR